MGVICTNLVNELGHHLALSVSSYGISGGLMALCVDRDEHGQRANSR